MLAGEEALRDPESKFYLADDYHFHGKGSEADYALDSYFGETATSMFGKVSPDINCRPMAHGLPLGVLVCWPFCLLFQPLMCPVHGPD